MLQIQNQKRFRKFLQVGTLIAAERLPIRQVRRLRYLQDTCFLCKEIKCFPDRYEEEESTRIGRQYWCLGGLGSEKLGEDKGPGG